VVVLGLAIIAYIVWFWCHPTTLREKILGRR